jgi:hypothetical protein
MDHHQTRHMFKLRWQSDVPAAPEPSEVPALEGTATEEPEAAPEREAQGGLTEEETMEAPEPAAEGEQPPVPEVRES